MTAVRRVASGAPGLDRSHRLTDRPQTPLLRQWHPAAKGHEERGSLPTAKEHLPTVYRKMFRAIAELEDTRALRGVTLGGTWTRRQ